MKLFWVATFFVIPFFVVALPFHPYWLGRALAASIFIFGITGAMFWFGLSPKFRIVRPGAKLDQPQFARVRPKVELAGHLFFAAIALSLCFYFTVPLAADMASVARGGRPVEVEGTAVRETGTIFGAWFIWQSVQFSPTGPSFQLLYSWGRFRPGVKYSLLVLPHSKIIVQVRQGGG